MRLIIYFMIYIILQNKNTYLNGLDKTEDLLRGRIVGGSEADIRNWPFIAALMMNNMHRCGGSLISKECVVTAAHCVTRANRDTGKWYFINSETLSLQLGSANLFDGFTKRNIKKIFVHSKYNSKTFDKDVALIIMNEAVSFTGKIKPIKVAEHTPSPETTPYCESAGWGYTEPRSLERDVIFNFSEKSYRNELPKDLLYVTLPLITMEECLESMRVTERMICTHDKGGKDACNGDSGGPLTCGGKLAGVVSWGIGCARPDNPGVYTNLAKFHRWITGLCEKYKLERGGRNNSIDNNFLYRIFCYIIIYLLLLIAY